MMRQRNSGMVGSFQGDILSVIGCKLKPRTFQATVPPCFPGALTSISTPTAWSLNRARWHQWLSTTTSP